MCEQLGFSDINDAKTNLDHVYDRADPRGYYSELRKLGYGIPNAAKPIFQRLISRRRQDQERRISILDVGCSYGINAALLKHDLSMDELYEHWGQETLADATPEQLTEHDRRHFTDLADPQDIRVIGLDTARNAVAFAEGVGLLDEAVAVNLEIEQLPERAADRLATVDLVTSTGCIGYVTEKSFERLLPAVTQGRPAWLANFVLRMFPFDAIGEALSDCGYTTEKLEGQTFIQRRYASQEEQQQVIEQLQDLGIDPTGNEADGHLLAEFYLSRPADEVAERPIDRLLAA